MLKVLKFCYGIHCLKMLFSVNLPLHLYTSLFAATRLHDTKKTKQQKAKISNRHKYEVTDKQQQQTFYEVYLLIFLSFSLVKLV